jgi:CubicO group peptidase (beta-lactamase class C family)
MLLSHTSSLAEGSKYNDFLAATYADTPPEVSQLLIPNGLYYNEDTWSSHKPGTFFQYSNINFGLLGTLIEAISGQRFDIYMREHVLAPLSIAGSFNIADIKDIN